jgi:hypothetical protein
MQKASSDDSVGMWVVTPPPPPPTYLEVASSSEDSLSDSSGYNDECPHVKEVNSYDLLLDFNCFIELPNVYTFIFRFKS